MAEKVRIIIEARNKFSKAFDRLKSSLKAVAVQAGVAFAAFGVAYVAGVKKAIDAASDLQEVQGKFDVVFKAHKDQAADMAKVLVKSYAMSEREAKQYLSSVQDLLVPMGMASGKAISMSNAVVQLAADLGSFNNVPTATVMLDIQSALVGNFETMKKYGVVLNETVIKQEALNLGLWNGKGMVDANTKAQVAYKLMMEGSAAAVGDQARTMGSYANQMKQLKAHVENVAAEIGNQLLPKATEWINNINTMIEKNPELIRQMGELAEKSFDVAAGLAKITYQTGIILKQTAVNLDKVLGISDAVKSYKELLRVQQFVIDAFSGKIDLKTGLLKGAVNRITEDFDNLGTAVVSLTSDTDQLGESAQETAGRLAKESAAVLQLEVAAKKLATELAKAEKIDLVEAEEMAKVYQRQFDVQHQFYADSFKAAKEAYDVLNEMWLEQNLTEVERLTMWYEQQQELFLGNEEALTKLKSVYTGKRDKIILDSNKKVLASFKKDIETEKKIEAEKAAWAKQKLQEGVNALQYFGETGKKIYKAIMITQAVASTAAGAARALTDYAYPYSIVIAAAVIASGLAQVSRIRSAHGGLTNVPKEQSYLLDRGERVLSPNQNQDFTRFIENENQEASGNGATFNQEFHVLENATNPDLMLEMSNEDWQQIVEDKIIPSMNQLARIGIKTTY